MVWSSLPNKTSTATAAKASASNYTQVLGVRVYSLVSLTGMLTVLTMQGLVDGVEVGDSHFDLMCAPYVCTSMRKM